MPSPQMIPLRDTSIREISNLPTKDSSICFRNSLYNNSGTVYQSQLPSATAPAPSLGKRDRDCNSPFMQNGPMSLATPAEYASQLGSRENNSVILRETSNIQPTAARIASNRFLSTGLDQRILKQSTEDCRRLLQQVGCLSLISNSYICFLRFVKQVKKIYLRNIFHHNITIKTIVIITLYISSSSF